MRIQEKIHAKHKKNPREYIRDMRVYGEENVKGKIITRKINEKSKKYMEKPRKSKGSSTKHVSLQ